MSTNSNDVGRALELQIVKIITAFSISKGISIILTERAKKDNLRDESYLDNLSPTEKTDFLTCSEKFLDWIKKEKWFNNIQSIELDRLPDSTGREGDVTDIRLKLFKGEEVIIKNISVKNNHNALKHPRILTLPEQCGINDEKIKSSYLSQHKKIWLSFEEKAKKLSFKATKFNELKKIDKSFKDLNIYKPLNKLVISFLEKNTKNSKNIEHFFKFITGNREFVTIKNESARILIKRFENIPSPSTFVATYPYKGTWTTFLLKFDNGWEITFRLHTASEHFLKNNQLQTSVKYDVNCLNIEKVIKTEEISKT